ncbi:MAG: M6 family metalloprotease domain-containing protein [Alloprevotella sp.]|nr:M6 family metalloprotease domain-containing protein [Alloprevotella sp.]
MRKIFTLFFCLLISLSVSAVPAKPGQRRLLHLQDGKTIQATLVGDEYGHFFLGDDGKTYSKISGTNYYGLVDAQAIKSKARERRAKVNASRRKKLAPQKVGTVGNYTGQKKGIVILVNFSDVSFQTANNLTLFKRIANEENFSQDNFKGSMYDYFKAQSQGQFELTFDVVGPYTMSKAQAYYGSNDEYDQDEHPAEMIIEAVNKANADVNFADYDWDGDGYVDQVYVIYAGQGEADGGEDETIWPHAYDLYSANYYGDGSGIVTVDGVKVNTYACGPELNGDSNIEGIGTMCHEFSHCLGYPDFYDIDYSGGQGMYSWDLMDAGSYNDDGYQPAGYTSYEKWMAGWLTPTELTGGETVTGMKALADGGEAYIIYNDNHSDEYFLLENRQQVGWDTSLAGSGLLVVHVDYDATVWENNGPNDDPSHQRMTWVPSDGNYNSVVRTKDGSKYVSISDANLAGDMFPSASVNSFGPEALGNKLAKLNNATSDGSYYIKQTVANITQNADGTISFNVVGDKTVKTPTFTPPAGRYKEAQNVTINCATTDATIYYTLDGTDPTASSTLYTAPISVTESVTLKAIAIKDGEESWIATGNYTIKAGTSTKYQKVTSLSEMVNGQDYIIACGSKAKAAGALSGSFLKPIDVTVDDDIITIDDDVTVFTAEGSGSTWAFVSDDGYLYSTATKSVAFSTEAKNWTLSENDGVVMAYSSLGTMLYNSSSPRFTTYTSTPSSSMIRATLYAAIDDGHTSSILAPTFSPVAGTYATAQDVTLTTATSGATIYYTLDGTEPTTSSTKYTGPITVSESLTLKAIAEKDGEISAVSTAAYVISAVEASSKTFKRLTALSEMVSGQRYIIACESKSAAASNMYGDYLKSASVTVNDDIITVGDDATIFTLEGSGSTWTIQSDAGYLYAMKTKKLDYDTEAHDWTVSADGGLILSYGSMGTMLYNANPGSERFTVYTSTPTSTMIQAHLYMATTAVSATVEAPTFTPAAGTYTTAQNVTITTSTSGATIYYTTDGTTPTTSSEVYSGPITVDEDMTIKAIAEKDGTVSSVSTAQYIISPVADTSLQFTKVSEVQPGKRYLIVYNISGTLKAQQPYSGSGTYGYLYANTTVTDQDGVVSVDDENNVFTFEAVSGGSGIIGRSTKAVSDAFYIKDSQGRYLYQTGSYNNFNLSTTVPATGGQWTAEDDGTGLMTLKNTSTNKWFQYNTSYNSTGAYSTAQATGVKPFLYEEAISTGILTPEIEEAAVRHGVYTLTGLRLPNAENLPKGIYIIDGKKVLIP